MATTIKVSADGDLRLVSLGRGQGRVELRTGETWTWCVWKNIPLAKAEELFQNQLAHHEPEEPGRGED